MTTVAAIDETLTSAAMEVAILANPYSGRGPNRKYVDQLIDALVAGGLKPRPVWDPVGRAQLLSDPNLARWCRCVVSAGGDGSLADVINDLQRLNPDTFARVPVATLPIGNENLFARQFGFVRKPVALARAIARGTTCRCDVGRVGGRIFTLMASAGFDADVVHRVAAWRRNGHDASSSLKRVSKLSYVGKIARSIKGYAYPPITVEADGTTVRGAHVFVFNLPQYGANLGIARHARGNDAMLDYVVFEKPGMIRLADYGMSVVLARHLRRGDVHHGKAHRIRISAEAPVPVQADGDPAGWTPLDITVMPAAVRVIEMG